MRDIQASGPVTAKRKKLFLPLCLHIFLPCKSLLYFWPFRFAAFRQADAFLLRCSVWILCSHCNQGFHSLPTFLYTFSWNLFTSVPSLLLASLLLHPSCSSFNPCSRHRQDTLLTPATSLVIFCRRSRGGEKRKVCKKGEEGKSN